MKAKYIGGEGLAGSGETVIYGQRVKCGATFEVPPGSEHKARINPAVEVLDDDGSEPAPEPRKPHTLHPPNKHKGS